MNRSTSFKTVKIRGKSLPLWIPVLAAVLIIVVITVATLWVLQNRPEAQGFIFTGAENREIVNSHIRIWTGPTTDTWSGMKTEQTWQLGDNLMLTTKINVTSLTSTFYTEIILVDEDADAGFGFQITASPENKVRITGWTWNEENESFTGYLDKETNLTINLQLKKNGTSPLEFYVDGVLLDSIAPDIPNSGTAQFNLDITNGAQGGNAEIVFAFDVQRIS
jgi:hypothetical protein